MLCENYLIEEQCNFQIQFYYNAKYKIDNIKLWRQPNLHSKNKTNFSLENLTRNMFYLYVNG